MTTTDEIKWFAIYETIFERKCNLSRWAALFG